jgi:phosphotransacetylase
MVIPEVRTFADILQRAKAKAAQKRAKAVLLLPSSAESIRAFMDASAAGLIEPRVIGSAANIRKLAEDHSLDIDRMSLIDIGQLEEAVTTAAGLARDGEIDLIVRGHIPVAELLTILLKKENAFRLYGRKVSHVAVLKPEKYPKLLMLTDGGVMPQPDLKSKIHLIQNLVFMSEALGIDNPRIAIVTAVEAIYLQMTATLDAAILSKMAERGQIKGARVDGPLSFDVAIDAFAASSKGIKDSSVAGQADAMVTSTIEVAQGIYNAMSLYGKCDIGGVIVGGRVPVAVNSWADSQAARFNSILLAFLVS